jgi:hypothetical protein
VFYPEDIMTFTTVPNVATGDALLASQQRVYVRNNFAANVPHMVTALGDIPVSNGANSITVLATGTNGKTLVSDSTQATGRRVATSGLVPLGGIVIWMGAVVDIPTGWQLCDGSRPGVPNLSDLFIVGAGSTYAIGATGGAATANLQHHHDSQTMDTAPNHTHTQANATGAADHHHDLAITAPASGGDMAGAGSDAAMARYDHTHTMAGTTGDNGAHDHTNPATGNGGGGTHTLGDTTNSLSTTQNILPPYFVLCYVMRVQDTLIYDTFTDGDHTLLDDHAPDLHPIGSTWADWLGRGALTIHTNKATMTAGEDYNIYAIESGQSDLIITVDIDIPADCNVAGIVVRATDSANYWRLFADDTTAYISESTAGVMTTLVSTAHGLGPGVATMTVNVKGTSITLQIGAANINCVSAIRQTATLVGLVAENVDPVADLTFENFLVTGNE